MNIRWHKRAAAQLLQVEEYVLRNFGEYTRQEFMDEVEQATLLLAEMPIMGKTDPLFVHRKLTYRSFIVRRLNKIVYYVKDDTLHIAAFWDTRREPKNQAGQTDYPISLIPLVIVFAETSCNALGGCRFCFFNRGEALKACRCPLL